MVTWRRMLRIMSTTFLRGVMSPAVLGDAALVAAVVQRFEMFVVGNTDCSLLHLLQGSVVTTVASGAEIESAVGQWAGLVQRGVCTVATVMELQSWLWLDVLQVIVDIVHFWKTHCDVIFKSTGCPATERPVLEGVVHLAASMVYAATYSRHASGSLSLTWRSVLHTIVSKLMPALRVSRPTLARLTCGALVMATAGKMPCLWTADKCPKKGLHAPMSGGGRAFPRCLLAPPKVPLRTEWHQPSHHSVQWLVRTIVSPDVARDVCSVLLDELPCADTFALGMGAEVQAVYDVLKEIAREVCMHARAHVQCAHGVYCFILEVSVWSLWFCLLLCRRHQTWTVSPRCRRQCDDGRHRRTAPTDGTDGHHPSNKTIPLCARHYRKEMQALVHKLCVRHE
jgi:hypothetical protein